MRLSILINCVSVPKFGERGRDRAKNYIGSDRMKKSNSRDRDNENQLNFHGDER